MTAYYIFIVGKRKSSKEKAAGGFKYFSTYLRGKEEMVCTVLNEPVTPRSTTPTESTPQIFFSGSQPELPVDQKDLMLSQGTQKRLSGYGYMDIGLPPASPSEREITPVALPEQPSSVLTHTTGDVEQNELEQLAGSQNKTSQAKSAEMEKPKALGFAARFATPENTGEPISDQLASSIDYLLSSKLEEKHLTETMDKYLQPSNCNNLLVPKVNPLVWENVLSKTRSLDLKLQRCQKPLVTGLIAMVKSFEGNDPSEVQQDAVALLSNAVFELNNVRKELIKPDLHQRYSHLCKQSQLTTQWLFGDDLPKKVKEIDEEHKAVAVMKTPQTKYANPSPTSTHRFNPMRPSTATRGFTRYQRAGWSVRSRAQSQSAFLGQPRLNLGPYRIPNKARDVPKRGKRTVDSDPDIHVWEILAELVKLNTRPSPSNPFSVDLEYFDSLDLGERVIALGAMSHLLQQIFSHAPDKAYAGLVADDLKEVTKRHFKDLRLLLKQQPQLSSAAGQGSRMQGMQQSSKYSQFAHSRQGQRSYAQ
ncbi:hypothetical protein HOLleu_26626 [Holothuria leucospilota]|uniref:DUF7886 domain-containing protein n=1 Tax=Holothuria leucospilota TaxID=206669 RepID=A0A9Q1BPD4_HOLLE|nr:hypothetical protein HOLleu_26626 [Holothuria leucospilota]